MKRGKRLEFETLVFDRVWIWFTDRSELPDGFPVSRSMKRAREVQGGSTGVFFHHAWYGIKHAVEEMSPHELRLWADRIRYDNL